MILVQGKDFYDFEGDTLSITKTEGPSWLEIEPLTEGIWQISGYPSETAPGFHTVSLNLSDGTHSTMVNLQFFVRSATDFRNVQIKAAEISNTI